MEDPKSSSKVDLSKIAHKLSNHLFVISMGVELLASSQNDPDRFAQTLQSIRQDGLEPLNDWIDRMTRGEIDTE